MVASQDVEDNLETSINHNQSQGDLNFFYSNRSVPIFCHGLSRNCEGIEGSASCILLSSM